jgi:hypothetical protein
MDKFKELNLKIEKTKHKRSTNNQNEHKINDSIKNENILKYILSIIENIEYLINNNI